MKKRFWILLLLLAVLTGCSQPQVSVDPDTGLEDGGQQNDPVKTPPVLLQQAEAVGTAGNLWYIPNNYVEALEFPNLHMVGENLLLIQYRYGEGDDCTALIKLLSLKDGSLLAEHNYDCSGYVRVQVMEDCVALCDSGDGWVRIMDLNMQLQRNYELEGNWGDWVLSPDLKNVYELHWEHGLSRINLEMKVRVPIKDGRETTLLYYDETAGEIGFSYLDLDTQRYANGVLNVKTGQVASLDLPVRAGWAIKDGDKYLISERDAYDRYHTFIGDRHYVMETLDIGQIYYMRDNSWLYTLDLESRKPTLYTMEGKVVSCGDLPGGEWVNCEPVWCESWGGYFFIGNRGENDIRLLFWDPKVQGSGTDLPMEPYAEPEEKPHTVEERLYQQAEALERRFGVDICIAEQCALDYAEFTGRQLTDAGEIERALQVLEDALDDYPEGFFQQLMFGRLESIRFELIYELQRKNWPDDAAYTSFSAFAQDMGHYYLIVIDVRQVGVGTYYHELSHVLDRRLGWDSVYRENALYSEEHWLKMQPQGFNFSYDYQRRPDNWEKYLDWFVDDYSMTMPTEDRARVMEYSMIGASWSFSQRPNLIPKLEYYGKCIRDTFDTTGWPAQTLWEQTLEQAKQELAGAAA